PEGGGGGPSTPSAPLPVDSLDMWGATAGLPEQVAAAVAASQDIGDLPNHEQVENVWCWAWGAAASPATS
ncbi:MAG TPA: hypothetical protein VFC03_08745, partial [Acidimicrobiales bacterium]|nr:hypothetical protein [Acidimicrobiales bacterium]